VPFYKERINAIRAFTGAAALQRWVILRVARKDGSEGVCNFFDSASTLVSKVGAFACEKDRVLFVLRHPQDPCHRVNLDAQILFLQALL
jgi:hypothetical protein